jgi:hypothetical protein
MPSFPGIQPIILLFYNQVETPSTPHTLLISPLNLTVYRRYHQNHVAKYLSRVLKDPYNSIIISIIYSSLLYLLGKSIYAETTFTRIKDLFLSV